MHLTKDGMDAPFQEGDDEIVWWWRQKEIDLCETALESKIEGLGNGLDMVVEV